MRIIGGKLKGRRFTPPSNFKGRPTTDFARESLCSILDNRIDWEGQTVLDLFAGSGAVSFEFASRGAKEVTAIELDHTAYRGIQKNALDWELRNVRVLRSDAFRFLRKQKKTWSLIFADPPYDLPNFDELVKVILEGGLLEADGLLIVEHGEYTKLDKLPNFQETRNYGHVHFSFFTLDS
jgi:16S rRNA (guanine966-N2)-methyltransferase